MKKHFATLLAVGLTLTSVLPLMATEQPKIAWDVAKKTALEAVPGGKTTSLELKQKNSQMVYEIKIVRDNEEYDIDIDANTGAIIEAESDSIPVDPNTKIKGQKSVKKIRRIAQNKVPDADIVDMDLQYEHDNLVYNVKMQKDTTQYLVKINAMSGAVVRCYEISK